MNVTIIGAGKMARGMGTRAVACGHTVTLVGARIVKAIRVIQQSLDTGSASTVKVLA